MKQGSLLIPLLSVLFILSGVNVFADEVTERLESRIVESFDTADQYQWRVRGSKFSTEGYPKKVLAKAYPEDFFGKNPQNQEDLRCLGVHARFNRKAYNFIEIIPGKGEGDEWTPQPVTLPGRVKEMDLWVWGSNYNYVMEAHFIDYTGVNHRLEMGRLDFNGWENMLLKLPNTIPQSRKYYPKFRALKLTKFVIRTAPTEKVDNYYVYFDHLKVLTDVHETLFDGSELTNDEVIEEIWANSDDDQGNEEETVTPEAEGGNE